MSFLKRFVALFLLILFLILCYHKAFYTIFTTFGRKHSKERPASKLVRKFRILLYTPYFGGNWEDKYPTDRMTSPETCSCTNCLITTDKQAIHAVDIVLFHGNDLLSPSDMRDHIPRNSRQIWIFMTQENPFTVNTGIYRIKDYNYMFNWTATYSFKADVVTPYFDVFKRKTEDITSRQLIYSNKKRLAMAIMSNCVEYRIKFIASIKRYMAVDLYGKCKNKINPKLDQCEQDSPECDKLQTTYKFFFAIENFYCVDYVTEKFYEEALLKGLVPIVLNGAKMSNTRIAPPQSFIDILDFPDAKSLATYIKYLDSNDTAYKEYHKWRESYEIKPHQYFCNLCKTLNTKYNSGKVWKAKNIGKIWNEKSCVRYENEMFQKYLL